jgi:hypothetical protein
LPDHRQREAGLTQPLARKLGQIGAAEQYLPGGRAQHAGDATQQRRLTATVAAEHDDQLAGLDIKVEASKRQLAVGVAHRQAADPQRDVLRDGSTGVSSAFQGRF